MAAIAAPAPADERARLAALRRYEILDSPREAAYDDLARVAATICSAPMAVISFLDESREWVKAQVGIEVDELPRDKSFCPEVVRQPAVLEVPDVAADERFADLPLVYGEPRVRGYAAAPLISSDGFALGTLAVLSPEPLRLDDAQRDAVEALGRQVVRLVEQRRVRTALVDATRALDEFSARTAHDLKNPIAAIRGYADVLYRRSGELDDKTRLEILDRLVALAGRTTDMIDNVLEHVRAGMSGMAPDCSSGEVVAQTIATADLTNAEVVVEPDADEWPHVAASVVDVHSILSNLVANADNYGRSRDGRLRLRLSVRSAGGFAVITVEDAGPGVDPTIRDEVFEPFVNGPVATFINPQSTGLGLALVRRVAQLVGGNVALEDTAVGARFVVRLPVVAR
ncbi:MAG TPA: GAF domain-containing sensor histidine kinase [Mycobacteriales bacterium]|nr:GAF domain-containing sensor histidine kinase [Mycobacteriales bacterium]